MPYCTQCRTSVAEKDKFCPSCGAEVNRAAAPPSPDGAPSSPAAPAAPGMASASLSPAGAAVLCYAFGFMSGIILLNLQPWARDRTVRFHAFQSIFFNIAWAVLYVVAAVVGMVVSMADPLGGAMMAFHFVVWGGGLALWIVLMVKAYKGERLMLPIIGRFAERAADAMPAPPA